jgi:hypothetical protein
LTVTVPISQSLSKLSICLSEHHTPIKGYIFLFPPICQQLHPSRARQEKSMACILFLLLTQSRE